MKQRMLLGLAMWMAAMSLAPVSWAQEARIQRVGMQVKDDLLAGSERFSAGAKSATEVNLDPNMLGMLPQNGRDISDLAHKLDFVVVRAYEYENAGMYKQEDLNEIRKRLDVGNWSCFLRVHDNKSGESTDMCSRSSTDGTNEMVIIAAEAKGVTFVHVKGRMSLNDLQKMESMGDMMRQKGAITIPRTAARPSVREGRRITTAEPSSAPTPPTLPTPPAPPAPPAAR